jgi:hypothetical protein
VESLRSFELNLTPELMLLQQGRDPQKRALNPGAMRVYRQVAERARVLVEPVALVDLFDVQAVHPDGLVLSNGHAFRSHLVIEQLAQAQQIVVAICTIGPRIEAESRRAFADGNALAGFLYDSAGTVAVGSVAGAVNEHVEKLAAASGLKASFVIAPGSADCTLEDQRVVFKLLPAETIGVRLTDHCVMVPGKSVSMLVGLGYNVPTRHEMVQCDFCPRRDTCPSARLRTGHSFEKS